MSLAREPTENWTFGRPRLSAGLIWAAVYGVAAVLASLRAYEIGYARYAPSAAQAGVDTLAFTVARDAGLSAATATAAAAFILFLAILGLRQAGARLLRGGQRRGA